MLTKSLFLMVIGLLSLHLRGSAAVSYAVPLLPAVADNPVAKNDKLHIEQMKFYSSLSLKEYEQLKGKKLNFLEKFSFRTARHRMKKMLKAYDREGGVSIFQKISWLIKGILLGPIAVLLGYIFLKGDEKELIKWIWFGFAGWVVIIIAVLVSV